MTVNDRNHLETAPKHHWGSRFKAAREALNLTEKDAAARLHLKPNLITIIENERFENGPPAIFMRGYIRSYGKLLNLSEREMTQALAQLNLGTPTPTSPLPKLRSQSTNYNNNIGWSTSLVVLVLVGLVGMWWHSHSGSSIKDLMTNIPMQLRSVMARTTTQTPQTTTTQTVAQAPADPTPTELTTPETQVTTNTAENNAPATAPTNAAPLAPQTAASTPVTQKPTDSPNPQVAAQAAPPSKEQTNPQTANTPDKTAAINEQKVESDTAEESDEPAVKPKKQHAKTPTPDVASNEMVIPEQGLEIDNNIN